MALDDPAAPEVVATDGNDARAPLKSAAPPSLAAGQRSEYTSSSPSTCLPPSARSTDAQGASSGGAASDSDEADDCCPGMTRADVVADPNGGELYASDALNPPPNQLGSAT